MLNIQKNISLSKYTTFRIGGPARFFVEISTEDELKEALDYAKNNKLNFFILGGGSNLLVSDKGFDGLVIKMKLNDFKIVSTNVEAGSGVALAKLVNSSIAEGLTGMEWAAGIPGTIGGAVRGNAGAFGKAIEDVVDSVKILDTINLQITTYSKNDCCFGYRSSIFKQNKNLVILSAVFKLQKGEREKSQQEVKEIIMKRISGQPQGMGSAGSFFMNPIVTDEKLRADFEKDTGKKCKDDKLPAGWLIDQMDLRGKKIGGAMVSHEHSNYIVNTGNATAEDVIMLVSIIKQQVRNKFGVQLMEEVQYLGF